MRVLITGAAGYVGRYLTRGLEGRLASAARTASATVRRKLREQWR